ncbi:hypothetical protein BS17DRAFT_129692 [Gyrodon lividus]|nr:hypothetical protein BS17DRAFT_129692 [Gyrodon lividus]
MLDPPLTRPAKRKRNITEVVKTIRRPENMTQFGYVCLREIVAEINPLCKTRVTDVSDQGTFHNLLYRCVIIFTHLGADTGTNTSALDLSETRERFSNLPGVTGSMPVSRVSFSSIYPPTLLPPHFRLSLLPKEKAKKNPNGKKATYILPELATCPVQNRETTPVVQPKVGRLPKISRQSQSGKGRSRIRFVPSYSVQRRSARLPTH